jgi:methylmalonyl-CoA mutase cobalamin-binding subunit
VSSITADELLPEDLPSGRELLDEGRRRGSAITITPSRYVLERGFTSERAWKDHARRNGIFTTYINLGYKTWAETADAINTLNDRGRRKGFRVDHVVVIADRRMGLPPEMRTGALEETGVMMRSDDDWLGTGRDADAQCVWADHNLNAPAADVNTEAAIRAGIGYIGNLAQNSYAYPDWPDDVSRFANTVKALGMLSAKRGRCVIDNFLDDGFCGSFHDVATMIGWAKLTRRLVDGVVGAEMGLLYGSQWSDPISKQAFGLALQSLDPNDTPISLTHGDTNSFGTETSFDRVAASLAIDVYFTAQRELRHPTGAALHVPPPSEAVRIPTIDDLEQSLIITTEAIARARACPDAVDWRPIYALRDQMLASGQVVYERMVAGLPELGVDIDDPLKMLLGTYRLGAGTLEQLFHAGVPDDSFPRGFSPVLPSEVLQRQLRWRDDEFRSIADRGGFPDLTGLRVVTASGDIHEYGLFVVNQVLERCGARVTSLGTSVGAADVAKVAKEAAADLVGISTYNGMALRLGRQVVEELRKRDQDPPVFLGGRLTEDREGEMSVDVRDALRAAGIHACDSAADMAFEIRPALAARVAS